MSYGIVILPFLKEAGGTSLLSKIKANLCSRHPNNLTMKKGDGFLSFLYSEIGTTYLSSEKQNIYIKKPNSLNRNESV